MTFYTCVFVETYLESDIFAIAFGEKSEAEIAHFTFKNKCASNEDKHNKYVCDC